MYRDLIIGFDGSLPARDALAIGRRLALATGARPIVVTVLEPTTTEPDDPAWDASVGLTLDAARTLMGDVPGTRFVAIADSSAARGLHAAAAEADAALIVLGATHRSGVGRVIPGTTADAVIHGAPCAVAITPAGYADRAHRRSMGLVAAAVDGGQETARVARIAGRIARDGAAVLRLVTVVEGHYTRGPLYTGALGHSSLADAVREAASATLDEAAAAAGADLMVECRIADGRVADQLARESRGADLLVIGSRAYGPLRRVVLGSATGEILLAATCPILVVPRGTEVSDDAVVPLAAAGAR